MRETKISIDDIIFAQLMERYNYNYALKYFLKAEIITEDIIAEIGINREFSLKLKSLQEATGILEHQRYIRLQRLIDSKFADEQILNIFKSH